MLGPAGGRGGAPGPPLPRPVLPRERCFFFWKTDNRVLFNTTVVPYPRGYLDKFVEYLVGDGPANRCV